MASVESAIVKPLGIFGVIAVVPRFATRRDALRALQNQVPAANRGTIATYLRSCTMILPFMEHADDVLDGRFSVPGGTAVCSDGAFYWRLDAAEYVEHYGIGLPAEFLHHGSDRAWTAPPAFDGAEVARIEAFLLAHGARIAGDEARGR